MPRSSNASSARSADRLRDEIGRAADRHQIDGAEFADGFDGLGPALGLADHAQQSCLGEHLARELIHTRGSRGPGGTDDLFAHRIDRADVVDEAAT